VASSRPFDKVFVYVGSSGRGRRRL